MCGYFFIQILSRAIVEVILTYDPLTHFGISDSRSVDKFVFMIGAEYRNVSRNSVKDVLVIFSLLYDLLFIVNLLGDVYSETNKEIYLSVIIQKRIEKSQFILL